MTNDAGPIWARALGFVALIFASVNIFGGFLVTQRMLGDVPEEKEVRTMPASRLQLSCPGPASASALAPIRDPACHLIIYLLTFWIPVLRPALHAEPRPGHEIGASAIMNANLAALLYLAAGVLFILALRGLSSPATSRQGNLFGMIGMAIAIVTTLASHPPAAPAPGRW